MGLEHEREGKEVYTRVKSMTVMKAMVNAGMASNDPNFKMPPMVNVLYETLDKERKNPVAGGMLSVPLDLDAKENIYAITYGKMKELLPEMKDAKDA